MTATSLHAQFSAQWGSPNSIHGKSSTGKYMYVEKDEFGNHKTIPVIRYTKDSFIIQKNDKVFEKTVQPVISEKVFTAHILQEKTWTYTQKNKLYTIYDFDPTGKCITITHEIRLHESESPRKAVEYIEKTLSRTYGKSEIDWRWDSEKTKTKYSDEYEALKEERNKLVITWNGVRLDVTKEYDGVVATIRYERPATTIAYDDIIAVQDLIAKNNPPETISYEELTENEKKLFAQLVIKE